MINIELDTTAVDLDAEIETNTIELDAELTYRGEKGPIGKTPDIQIGEVETIEENEDATVIRRGTVDEPILDFKLPRGKSGIQGPQGPVGTSGVYCGEKEPIDDEYKVWIIPDGMPSEYITDEEFIEKVNRAEEASYSLESNARYAREQGDYSKSIANSILEAKAEGQFDGATFTPSVDSKGNLSWNNNKGLVNPEDKNIRGPQGPVGPQGEPFRIRKTYESIELMNDDFENMSIGDYVMIATSVNLEDNAKLYVKSEDSWIFITDFSGATGIQGEQGIQGIQGIQGPQGPKPVRGVDYFTENDISSMVKSITDNSNSEFNRNVATAQENFNKNVSAKVSEFNDNAIQKVQSFNDSVDKLQSNINENSLAIKEIFNSLPTNIAKGKEIYINDAINRKVKSLKIYGKCEQKTTNGYQLFDESKLPSKTQNGTILINNEGGSFTIKGNDILSDNFSYSYAYSHEETIKLLKAGNIAISDDGVVGQTTVPYYFVQLRNNNGQIFEISNRITNSYSKTITQEMLDD
ncbi:MAG: hypothetical protein HFF38_12590, partial [Lawsonibacter sp.]|nr:hypothetical protein [Lawsonibacter sp.]